MEFRLAHREELSQIKEVFRELNDHMMKNGIFIWDDFYPCEVFEADIEKSRLYVLVEGDEILSAFALCEKHSGAQYINWEDNEASALYFKRFGVNPKHLRKGIASIMLDNAVKVAGDKGAEYLRLFAVEVNEPAMKAYLKSGFKSGEGLYVEEIEDAGTYREIGLEIKTSAR